MTGMTCTRCFRPTGSAPDVGGMLDAQALGLLCKEWKCDDCLNDLDLEAINRGEPPPSGAWGLVESELNDCYADMQEGREYGDLKERIDMLTGLLEQRDAKA